MAVCPENLKTEILSHQLRTSRKLTYSRGRRYMVLSMFLTVTQQLT